MKKWVGNYFQSSTCSTPEFNSFSRAFKKYIKENLPKNAELVNFSKGHFYCSGFVKKEDKYVYFSISDVRYFPDQWYNQVLVRTAKNEKDYSGGFNGYTKLDNFKKSVETLLS